VEQAAEVFEPERVARMVLDEADSLLDAESMSIMRLDPETDAFTVLAAKGREYHPKTSLRAGEGIAGLVLATGEPIHLDDARRDPRFKPGHGDIRSLACLPLKVKGRIVGVLNVSASRVAAFGPEELRLLGLLAQPAAAAMGNAQLLSRLERSESQYRSLVDSVSSGIFRVAVGPVWAFVKANQAMAGMLGFQTVEELLRVEPRGLFADPLELDLMLADLRQAGRLRDAEARLLKAGGGEVHVRLNVSAKNQAGRIAFMDGVCEDMTDIRRSQALKRERERIKRLFGQYVPPEVRDQILDGRIPLDGETKDVTVLFADLRAFTPLVESLEPREVVRVLNRYFGEMTEVVQQRGGVVLQYVGDEVYAVFGAPMDLPDHPALAARAALDMGRRLEAINAERAAAGAPVLAHGVGLHTGPAVAATIGGADRLSYALIGETVNLASRLQDLTKTLEADIILSRAVRERLDPALVCDPLPPARVRGLTGEVEIFSLKGEMA
jgi:PAS domain S-box-containing protein